MSVPYVGIASGSMALAARSKLQDADKNAGIIFVSVKAIPVVGGDTRDLNVVLGLRDDLDPSVGPFIVGSILKKEIEEGWHFNVTAFNGHRGKA